MGTPSRTADMVALAQATDAHGNVDFTAYEAQRLILQHQSIEGMNASALVGALVSSPAYADPEAREQIGPLIKAITRRLPSDEVDRFKHALDVANVNEAWWQRGYEDYVEYPVSVAADTVGQLARDGLQWTDQQISDNLVAMKRWADGVRDNPQNNYLERAAGALAGQNVGNVQFGYGVVKGATSHGLTMLGETVDLAAFAGRFSTNEDFRNLVIGAAAIYASDAARDPMKPVDDIGRAARNAWVEWEAGYEKAVSEGQGQKYLGETGGAAAIEIIATFVPATKLTKLGKLARAAEGADDLAPAGQVAGRIEGKVAGQLAEEVVELARDAARVQARGGIEGEGADLAFYGLAGMKRTQGELLELVEGLRKTGDLDGLLKSGALRPKELSYLARQDVDIFEGKVSFHDALNAHIGKRELSELSDPLVGEIGEAIVAHNLAKQGYLDIVPIQNNSGHGNDLAGFNPDTGRWEVVEIKSSVQGIAKNQRGDPEEFITSRLNLAVEARGQWAPKNMWEEQAKQTAERILKDAVNPMTGTLDVDPKWARVNIERDPVSGELKATPDIDTWKSPAERKLEREQLREQQRSAVEPERSDGPEQSLALLPTSDRQIFDKIRDGTPAHIPNEVVAGALYAVKKAGIGDASEIASVSMVGDRLMVGGTTPGFYAIVDTTQLAQPLQATAQDTLAFNQSQAAVQQEEESRRLQRGQDGASRSV